MLRTPLTITDSASRYVFAFEALSTTKEAYEHLYETLGLVRLSGLTRNLPWAKA